MTRRKTPKINSTYPLSIFAIPTLIILLLVISIVSAPIEFVEAVEQKPVYNNPLEILTIPVVQAETSTEYIDKKMVAVVPKTVQKKSEARLKIIKIGVDAVIKEMGFTPDGAMAVPGNRIDVGWFSLGTRPGDIGSAVIGGHNEWESKAGVFINLDQLEKGDVLSVVDSTGNTTSFIVRDIQTFNATDPDSGIFESNSGIHLNLITCSGDWDPSTNSYTERLVIFTDVIPAVQEI